jgi:histone H3/H4
VSNFQFYSTIIRTGSFARNKTLFPKAPFHRLVREISQKYSTDLKWQQGALWALQEGAEHMMVRLLEDASLCEIRAKRVTVRPNDMLLAKKLVNYASRI